MRRVRVLPLSIETNLNLTGSVVAIKALFLTTETPFDALHLLLSTSSGQAGQAEEKEKDLILGRAQLL